jgi:cell wall-associated NlpC family hydrolase
MPGGARRVRAAGGTLWLIAMADPRLTPARADLAAKHLKGIVAADRFVAGEEYEVVAASAAMRREPSHHAPLDTEALKGERVTVYEMTDEGWAWGQLKNDLYVGWLARAALAAPGPAPTHKVAALRTFAFPGPSIKLPPVDTLSLGCAVAITRAEKDFAVTTDGLWLPAVHLASVGANESDFVAVAERFVGIPYLWGGKTSLGVDCSGLVQIALGARGIAAPRDSDMQAAGLGEALPPDQWHAPARGDLIFWPGHVAIARGPRAIVHANAHHMAVAIEDFAAARARIAASGSDIVAVKRLPGLRLG